MTTYVVGAGQDVNGGSFPSQVVADVWTPNRDVSDNITDDSWKSLPLERWVLLADSDIVTQTENLLTAAGWNYATNDYGSGKIWASWSVWVGVAFDIANDMLYCPWGGGHFDSSCNGIWRIDLNKMKVAIQEMPSDPNAVGYVWDAQYAKSVPDSGSFTNYQYPVQIVGGPAGLDDMLPDGTPTSRHTYNGVWFDTSRRELGQVRESRWTYNVDTNTLNHDIWLDLDDTTKLVMDINCHTHYYADNDKVYGILKRNETDYYSWRSYNPNTKQMRSISGFGGGVNGAATCQIGRSIVTFCAQDSVKWGIFDCLSETFKQPTVTVPNGFTWLGNQEMQVCVYVPEWNKIVRRFTSTGGSVTLGDWYLVNPLDGVHTQWIPAGDVPPLAADGNKPGRKCFYYEKRKCIVYIVPKNDNTDSIYVMRVG